MIRRAALSVALAAIALATVTGSAGAWKCPLHPDKPGCTWPSTTTTEPPVNSTITVPDTTTTSPVTTTTTTTMVPPVTVTTPLLDGPSRRNIRFAG